VSLVIVTPPTVEPLTAGEVRAFIGPDSEDFDQSIDALIKAERQRVEGDLDRALNTQTWDWIVDCFPDPCGDGWGGISGWSGSPGEVPKWSQWFGVYGVWGFQVPLPPLQAIVSLSYVDANGVTQTMPSGDYRVIGKDPAYLLPGRGKSWPSVYPAQGSVTIRIRTGYGDAPANVPEPIRTAIVLGISHLRSLTERNLFVSSENVAGVGSTNYTVGGGAGNALAGKIAEFLAPYRVRSGIT
jgi:hypothetical protein